MNRIKVLLADDHAILLEGVRSLLKPKFDVVGAVRDGRALLMAAQQLRPDVIVADISMPLLNGLDAARQLKRIGVNAKIIFLTMHAEMQLVTEAFRAGASGYLLKQSAGEELINAINEVISGRSYVTPLITKGMLNFITDVTRKSEQPAVAMTLRQREVLQLIAEGRTMKEIASILNISPRTVESHKYDMMKMLGVEKTVELIQHAIKIGLVSVSHLPTESDR